MSERTFGFVTSVFSVGGLLGAITAGSVSDRFGRKRAIIFNCLGFIIGPMLMAMSQTVSVLSVGRIISGISAGSSVVIAPLYIHNVAPVEHAGALYVAHHLPPTMRWALNSSFAVLTFS